MLKISVINPYHTTDFNQVIGDVDLNGFTKLNLSNLALNQPYQLEVEINQNFPYFKEFITNPKNHSLKIQTDYVDLGFINIDGKQHLNSKLVFTMYSQSQKLANTVSYPSQVYSGSLNNFISGLNPEFIFTNFSEDININIDTTDKNDLELLTEAVELANSYSWRDEGMIFNGVGWQPVIIYGNFEDSYEYYLNTNKKTFEPLVIQKTTYLEDNDNPNSSQFENITRHFDFNYFNRIFVYANTGATNNQNTVISVSPSMVRLNPNFPLISTTKKGKELWYIQVRNVPALPIQEKSVSYSFSANSQDEGGTQTATVEQSAQYAYQQAINYIRNQVKDDYFSLQDKTPRRVVLPGTTARVIYNEQIEYGINLDTRFVLGTISDLDLITIKN
jgi:hypothetical protein